MEYVPREKDPRPPAGQVSPRKSPPHPLPPTQPPETERNTASNVNYYLVEVANPKRLEPYTAECEDIIEALGMNFAEGCAFKALWRRCAAKKLGLMKKNYDGPEYDAEKVVYYGQRMVAQDKKLAALGEHIVGMVSAADFHHDNPKY